MESLLTSYRQGRVEYEFLGGAEGRRSGLRSFFSVK